MVKDYEMEDVTEEEEEVAHLYGSDSSSFYKAVFIPLTRQSCQSVGFIPINK